MKKVLLVLFILSSIFSNAANRYWVGGSAFWDATAGTKWALTSGGAGGQAVPTSSDAVFFDAASGASTVTLNATGNCASINCTGFAGTLQDLTGYFLNVSGSVTWGNGMTLSLFFISIKGTGTITSNGKTIVDGGGWEIASFGITVTLGDNFTIPGTSSGGYLEMKGGTFTANGFNVSLGSFIVNVSMLSAATVNMGSGTWTIENSAAWDASANSGFTLNASTSTLKLTSTAAYSFKGGGFTYNNVWFSHGGSTNTITVTGSNTFNDLKDDGTGSHLLRLTSGTTTTVSSLSVNGASCSNMTSLAAVTAGSAATISDASGTNTVQFLSIKDITATGGATFIANNSTNVSGNTGWTINACVVASGKAIRSAGF